MKKITHLLMILALFSCSSSLKTDRNILIQCGEVTDHSVIFQCRTAQSSDLIDLDIPGKTARVFFEYSGDSLFDQSLSTKSFFLEGTNDYIAKEKVYNLDPNKTYYYRAVAKYPDKEHLLYSRTASLKTLPGKAEKLPVRFAIATGFNYEHFYGLDSIRNRKNKDPRHMAAAGQDSALGFPAFDYITKHNFDFFVANGDVVYYDKPSCCPDKWARTPEELRAKWHRFFAMPRNREMLLRTPVYYLKDDHDHRFNDCDTTNEIMSKPSNQLGIAIFKEQVPIVNPLEKEEKTYRTVRVNQDLQVWFVEGRDYRSPNSMPDTPEKTIWGLTQKQWLKSTLLTSNATFKVLISPTPMVGPDDAYKKDNHTNPGGFQSEQQEFFEWLTAHDRVFENFYIICGDRHWQYHSIHPLGIEEFSCGAFIDQNSRAGRLPGDPKSTDPEGKVAVPYVQGKSNWGGGFLEVAMDYPQQEPVLNFVFRNTRGKVNYQTRKTAK